MNQSHTPGPWSISRSGRVTNGTQTDHVRAMSKALDTSGETATRRRIPTAERQANARLIAAAPDLLAACEDALTALIDPTGPIDTVEAADVVREAIAKAKGVEA